MRAISREARRSAAAVGAAVMLLASALSAQPDPRQMSGQPLPSSDVPNGTVSVRVIREALANNLPDQPVDLLVNGATRTEKTDANGRATFASVAPGAKVRARATVSGETLESVEFAMPATGGIRLILAAGVGAGSGGAPPAASTPPAQPATPGTVSFTNDSRVVMDIDDDVLVVYYLLELRNVSAAPVATNGPLILDLPTGAVGAGSLDPPAPNLLVKGTRVTVSGPFAPGVTPVNVGFNLPYNGPSKTITQSWPAALEQTSVIIRKVGDVRLSSPQITRREDVQMQEQTFLMGVGSGLPSGGEMTLTIEGLPHRSATPRIIALSLAGAIVLCGVITLARGSGRETSAARRRLEQRRESLLGELAAVERSRETGRLDEADYGAKRTALMARLEHVYAALDSGEA